MCFGHLFDRASGDGGETWGIDMVGFMRDDLLALAAGAVIHGTRR